MPLRKCIALHLVMDVVHLAAVITQSDLSFTGGKKKKTKPCFFSDETVPHFTPHIIAA